jgi:hypothetical protein
VLLAVPFACLPAYPRPPGGFYACPLVPLLPTAALAIDIVLLTHLPWQAGVRLAVVAVLVVLTFVSSFAGPRAETDNGNPLSATLISGQHRSDDGPEPELASGATMAPAAVGAAADGQRGGSPSARANVNVVWTDAPRVQ